MNTVQTRTSAPTARPSTGSTPVAAKKVVKVDFTVSMVPGDSTFVRDGKFTAIPPQWSVTKHKPIPMSDFVDDASYYEAQALRHDEAAKRARDNAANSRMLGNVKDKPAAMKRIKALSKIEHIIEGMMDEGREEWLRLHGFAAQVDVYKAKKGTGAGATA